LYRNGDPMPQGERLLRPRQTCDLVYILENGVWHNCPTADLVKLLLELRVVAEESAQRAFNRNSVVVSGASRS